MTPRDDEQIRAGERLARRLSLVPVPESVWDGIQAELTRPASGATGRTSWQTRSPWLIAATIAVAFGTGAVVGTYLRYAPPTTWSVTTLSGLPRIGTQSIPQAGRLPVGEWLETDPEARALLAVGRIGTVEVGPESRLKLSRARVTDQRLMLERGTIRAVISAPPRLFFVETPLALATDLGCAYTLNVDSTGASRLHVTQGWVELSDRGRVAIVPAGMVAEVQGSRGPGTPFAEDAPEPLRLALARIDAGHTGREALDSVLALLHGPDAFIIRRQRDGVTLWHLLQRSETTERAVIHDRLAALIPPPAGVTREGIQRLDRRMLERWREALSPLWSVEAQPWPERLSRKLWEILGSD